MPSTGEEISSERITVESAAVQSWLPDVGITAVPSRRDLLLQALLHLPRLADVRGTVKRDRALREIERLDRLRAAELAPWKALAEPPRGHVELRDLEVRVIDTTSAATILDRFHYLRSARSNSVSVAAMHRHRIVALCSFSRLDLPLIGAAAPIANPDGVRVVSRVFAFDWAPRNTISYLLSRAEAAIAGKCPELELLLTYV